MELSSKQYWERVRDYRALWKARNINQLRQMSNIDYSHIYIKMLIAGTGSCDLLFHHQDQMKDAKLFIIAAKYNQLQILQLLSNWSSLDQGKPKLKPECKKGRCYPAVMIRSPLEDGNMISCGQDPVKLPKITRLEFDRFACPQKAVNEAARKGHDQILRFLLQTFPYLKSDLLTLSNALQGKHPSTIELVKACLPKNLPVKAHRSLLDQMIIKSTASGDLEHIKMLLEACPQFVPTNNRLFEAAINSGNSECVAFIKSLYPWKINFHPWVDHLCHACYSNNVPMIQYLEHEFPGYLDRSPLDKFSYIMGYHNAASSGSNQAIQAMHALYPTIEPYDDIYEWAASGNHPETILLIKQLFPNCKARATVLPMIAKCGHVGLIELFSKLFPGFENNLPPSTYQDKTSYRYETASIQYFGTLECIKGEPVNLLDFTVKLAYQQAALHLNWTMIAALFAQYPHVIPNAKIYENLTQHRKTDSKQIIEIIDKLKALFPTVKPTNETFFCAISNQQFDVMLKLKNEFPGYEKRMVDRKPSYDGDRFKASLNRYYSELTQSPQEQIEQKVLQIAYNLIAEHGNSEDFNSFKNVYPTMKPDYQECEKASDHRWGYSNELTQELKQIFDKA